MKTDRDKFRITTRAIIFNDNDEVLLLKNTKKNKWTFPGGHLDHGEQVNQAVIREVKEETNIDGEVLTPLEMYIHKKKCIVFLLVEMITDDIELSDEHDEFMWVHIPELTQYDLDHPALVERAELGLKIRNLKNTVKKR